jgi:hypothetical protein
MENMVLTGIQTQWLRGHNRFAIELGRIRPDWRGNDDLLYQEAKKILTALHQHFVYEFWLPILVGEENAKKYFGESGTFSKYDPTVSIRHILVEPF